MELIQALGQRLAIAAQTWPDRGDWLITLGWLGLYAAFAVPWGWGRLLQWDPVGDRSAILSNSTIALVFPALFEEILFRVLPLPLPDRMPTGAIAALPSLPIAPPADLWLWPSLSLLLFILAHPLNALLFFPRRRSTFYNPTFLTLAGLLGLLCTLAYLQSGSLWPPVLLHWLIVVVWLLLLGGCRRLGFVA
ncbi:MAG: CPBP family glutamic-type intramembrane protease [Prochlorothrix sp.]|nr:CPBP family glutamic-type intramembrane protease [Prochlorothrix sp.]